MADELNPLQTPDPEAPQEPEASAGTGEGEASNDAGFNMDEFRKSLETEQEAAVSRAEFEAVKRQAGQTRDLQRKLADLEAQLASRPASGVTREEYDLLVDALADLMPEDRRSVLAATREQRNIEQKTTEKFSEFEKRLFDRLGISDDPAPQEGPDPEVELARLNAGWQAASKAVVEHMQRRGVALTQAEMDEVQREVGWTRPDLAVEKMVAIIDQRASSTTTTAPAPAREDRVAERKQAAAGGVQGAGDGGRGNYDLTTISGIARARKDGAITSAKFAELYRDITSGR